MQDKKTTVSHVSDEAQTIDLYSTFTDVARHWLSLILLTAAAVLVSYVVLMFVHPLDYATSATMVVTNVDEERNASGTSGTEVYENLNYAADSASRLKNILSSRELKSTVAKELGLREFVGNATAATLGNSNLLEITVRADSPYISYRETESILRNYTRFSGDLVGGVDLTVLEKPNVPEQPEHPLQNVKYAIIIGIGVFIAVCAVLSLLSLMRDTVRTSKEVESKVDTKLLATIIHEKKHRRGRKRIGGEKASILITDPVTSFQYAEGMRKLATRLLNEMAEQNYKTLLVSSTTENEGKSTVAVNIALAMSQIDKKVLLIDMDFRKPAIYKILNMQQGKYKDLSSFMEQHGKEGREDILGHQSELITKVPGTELSVVFNRKAIPQAMEKYVDAIKCLIEGFREEADYIVIDTAPISLVSDAEELATLVDTSVIVVRQHMVEARDINDTIDALGGRERILGCVFNNARKDNIGLSSSGYGYGYGYGYGGQYAE